MKKKTAAEAWARALEAEAWARTREAEAGKARVAAGEAWATWDVLARAREARGRAEILRGK